MIKIDKIELHNFRFFTNEQEHNSFEPNGQSMLVYGENGSGKSSLYRAFEFLVKPSISQREFDDNKNIFHYEDESYLYFYFSNNEEIRIDSDHLSLENHFPFIKELSIPKPLLDYKSLLKIHYRTNQNNHEINIYQLFEKLLEDYPIGEDGKKLKELRGQRYFNTLEDIVKNQLFDNMNLFLEKFEHGFRIENIAFDAFEREIILKIEYFNERIEKYHIFLNEARLSALAISIYFAIIKKQFSLLDDDSLKILVLDDLLISLDMNNRLSLLDILRNEFSDFQIFFFTHDKALFEVFKDKMSWKSYEVYVQKDYEEEFEKPYIKKYLDYFETAKKHFDEYDYPACANYLRKEVERIKKLKDKSEKNIYNDKKIFKKFKKMIKKFDLRDNANSGRVIGKLIGFKEGLEEERDSEVEIDLKDIRSITDRILNPQSDDDTSRPLYKRELEDAIVVIRDLRATLENGVVDE